MNPASRSEQPSRCSRDNRLVDGVVANLAVFQDATPRDRAEIASYAWQERVRRGARACSFGEPVRGFIAVAYGMLKLSLPRADGEGRVLRFVGAGETFGEAPALAGQPAPYDAIALADSMLVVVPRRPVLKLIERHPMFAQALVATLAEKYLTLLAELQSHARKTGLQRLASYLVSLGEAPSNGGTWTARLPATKTAIAARLGVSKETLSRMLRDLSNRGLIAVAQREIALLDRERLEQLAL